jgi:hypothetical protein
MAPPPDDEDFKGTAPIFQALPPAVVRMLQKHFYAGVKEAEVRFRYHSADEDAVTGALGDRLIEPETLVTVGGQIDHWSAVYHKIRGRGPNAPEKRIGADGIFQLEVLDQQERFILRKGLLFQSKIGWKGRNGKLLRQARDILAQSRSSILIDYSANGYKAIGAKEVVAAGGNRRLVSPEDDKSLAQVLGDEFVLCARGDRGLYWESERERLVVNREQVTDFLPENYFGTRIQRVE